MDSGLANHEAETSMDFKGRMGGVNFKGRTDEGYPISHICSLLHPACHSPDTSISSPSSSSLWPPQPHSHPTAQESMKRGSWRQQQYEVFCFFTTSSSGRRGELALYQTLFLLSSLLLPPANSLKQEDKLASWWGLYKEIN